jgi:hypothetical protein
MHYWIIIGSRGSKGGSWGSRGAQLSSIPSLFFHFGSTYFDTIPPSNKSNSIWQDEREGQLGRVFILFRFYHWPSIQPPGQTKRETLVGNFKTSKDNQTERIVSMLERLSVDKPIGSVAIGKTCHAIRSGAQDTSTSQTKLGNRRRRFFPGPIKSLEAGCLPAR